MAQILSLGPRHLTGGEYAFHSFCDVLCSPLTGGEVTLEVCYFLGTIVKPSQHSISPWPFGLLFFYLKAPWSFSEEKLIHIKFHIKLKKLEFYFNFSLLPSSKMVASESLQIDIPSRMSPSESAVQSPGNPTPTGCWRCRFDLWVRKIPWRRKWQPTPVFLPEKSHGQRSLAVYSPWDRRVGHEWAHIHTGQQKGNVFTTALAAVS